MRASNLFLIIFIFVNTVIFSGEKKNAIDVNAEVYIGSDGSISVLKKSGARKYSITKIDEKNIQGRTKYACTFEIKKTGKTTYALYINGKPISQKMESVYVNGKWTGKIELKNIGVRNYEYQII